MIPTTFIFGAGVSMPFGFPSGLGLLRDIVSSLQLACYVPRDAPPSLHELLQASESFTSDDEVKNYLHLLQISGANSIDTFVRYRPEFSEISKLLISFHLRRYEKAYSYRAGLLTENPFSATESIHWNYYDTQSVYRYLWNEFIASDADIYTEINRHRFVTFNYDRLLEFSFALFFKGLCPDYDHNGEHIESVPITHIYGDLGPMIPSDMECHDADPDHLYVDFSEDELSNMITRSSGIHLARNNSMPQKTLDTLSHYFDQTRRIVICGFGYDKFNSNIISMSREQSHHEIPIYGSALGKTKPEMGFARDNLGDSSAHLYPDHMRDIDFLRHLTH